MKILSGRYVALTYLLVAAAVIISSTNLTVAHSGGTDSAGGHNCYVGSCAGTYHYHNGGGGGSYGPSEYAQANIHGAEHARSTNRANIESAAGSSARSKGYASGFAGQSFDSSVSDNTYCDQQVQFTNPSATESYKSVFQASYTRSCTSVYSSAYFAAYTPAFREGEANKLVADEQKIKEAELAQAELAANNSNNMMWVGLGIAAVSYVGYQFSRVSPKK